MADGRLNQRQVKPVVIDDQKSAAEIQEQIADLKDQTDKSLSQLKRIIFGDSPGSWNSDFSSIFGGDASLKNLFEGGGSSGDPNKPHVTVNKRMPALVTTGNESQACAIALSLDPALRGYVDVLVNGQSVELGDGTKNADCYFSGDSGSTARSFSDVQSGDVLYWNGVNAGYNLDASDIVEFHYEGN